MKILFIGHKDRGKSCLKALYGKHEIAGVIINAVPEKLKYDNSFEELAKKYGLPIFQFENINDSESIEKLKSLNPALVVIAGYSQIVNEDFISLAKFGCINLHGGKLPEHRGSSPMNWTLINGETEFTVCIIQVKQKVDAGDILIENTFPIAINDTIRDLHKKANEVFPKMLIQVIEQIEKQTIKPRKQDESRAAYYPLRFPDDGLILWDMFTAEEIHNRIRALTDPYPGAFTYYKNCKIKLRKSSLTDRPFYGEPGRIYQKKRNKLLVCAKDKCLWIESIVLADTLEDFYPQLKRYERLATVRDKVKSIYEN